MVYQGRFSVLASDSMELVHSILLTLSTCNQIPLLAIITLAVRVHTMVHGRDMLTSQNKSHKHKRAINEKLPCHWLVPHPGQSFSKPPPPHLSTVGSTRSSSNRKLEIKFQCTSTTWHQYFNHTSLLWNTFSPIDLSLSFTSIKRSLKQKLGIYLLHTLIQTIPAHFVVYVLAPDVTVTPSHT